MVKLTVTKPSLVVLFLEANWVRLAQLVVDSDPSWLSFGSWAIRKGLGDGGIVVSLDVLIFFRLFSSFQGS
ncbi:hypothetical protein V6N13_033064 [Hibiscus sabdariffa]